MLTLSGAIFPIPEKQCGNRDPVFYTRGLCNTRNPTGRSHLQEMMPMFGECLI
jgi:hypothetical protein